MRCQEYLVRAGNRFRFEHGKKDRRKRPTNQPAVQWVEHDFMGAPG